MKIKSILSLILICLITASLIIFTKAVCEDDDFIFDSLFDLNDYFRYKDLFTSVLLASAIFYICHNLLVLFKSIITYLARYEKSPPVNSALSLVF